jgi:hypothetical protein
MRAPTTLFLMLAFLIAWTVFILANKLYQDIL